MYGTAMVGDLIASVSKRPTPVRRPCIKGADDLAIAPDDQRTLKIVEFGSGTATRVGVGDQPAGGSAIGGNFGVFNSALIFLMGYKRFLAIAEHYMDVAILIGVDT